MRLWIFIVTTPNYIYELMEYHSTDSKQKLSQTVIELIKEHEFKTVLDFGAGICQDSIVCSKRRVRSYSCRHTWKNILILGNGELRNIII